MRHGLTLGELGKWFVDHFKLDVDYRVIEMPGWQAEAAPGFGWPPERIWMNPSPNAANLNMARAYAGTVMLEGATLSEGRGTTRPLELFGAPDLEPLRIMAEMERLAPQWLAGCKLREVTSQLGTGQDQREGEQRRAERTMVVVPGGEGHGRGCENREATRNIAAL
jgi:uncharacterized protein YbbC (DUF1343 family)